METDAAHTYKGIHETKTSERNNNSAWPYGPHPSVPSHLELGDPDGERENAMLKSPGHEYARLEQPSQTQGQNHQKPQPYEVPVTVTFNRDTSKSESVVLNGNHQYAKPESRRQILNYKPQGHEDIVAMASGGREYAESDLDKPHTYATLEPPASK